MYTGHVDPHHIVVIGHEGEYDIVHENDKEVFTCCTCYNDCNCSYGRCDRCVGELCYNCAMGENQHPESESEPETKSESQPETKPDEIMESESESEPETKPDEIIESDDDDFDPFSIPFSIEKYHLITFYFSQLIKSGKGADVQVNC